MDVGELGGKIGQPRAQAQRRSPDERQRNPGPAFRPASGLPDFTSFIRATAWRKSMTNDGAAATIGRGEWGFARHGKSAVGCRGGRDRRHRLRHQRQPRRGELAAGRHRPGSHLSAGAPSAQGAGSQDCLRRDQSRGRGDRGSDQGRHIFRVRLYRRRPATVRAQGPGDGIQPRLPGAARGPADERAVLAVVLLGHHAADRARIFLGARAHTSGRRSGCRPRPTSSSARSRRHCSSGPISPSSRARKCSW